jgi:hypothetical protein
MPPRLVERLDAITSVHDVEQLRLLEEIVKSIEPVSLAPSDCAALFRLFERFPDEDAFGLFFSLLHRLERSPGYEAELIRSVDRNPVEFNLEMVARMVRGGVTHYRLTNLVELLRSIAQSAANSAARQYAANALSGLESSGGA